MQEEKTNDSSSELGSDDWRVKEDLSESSENDFSFPLGDTQGGGTDRSDDSADEKKPRTNEANERFQQYTSRYKGFSPEAHRESVKANYANYFEKREAKKFKQTAHSKLRDLTPRELNLLKEAHKTRVREANNEMRRKQKAEISRKKRHTLASPPKEPFNNNNNNKDASPGGLRRKLPSSASFEDNKSHGADGDGKLQRKTISASDLNGAENEGLAESGEASVIDERKDLEKEGNDADNNDNSKEDQDKGRKEKKGGKKKGKKEQEKEGNDNKEQQDKEEKNKKDKKEKNKKKEKRGKEKDGNKDTKEQDVADKKEKKDKDKKDKKDKKEKKKQEKREKQQKKENKPSDESEPPSSAERLEKEVSFTSSGDAESGLDAATEKESKSDDEKNKKKKDRDKETQQSKGLTPRGQRVGSFASDGKSSGDDEVVKGYASNDDLKRWSIMRGKEETPKGPHTAPKFNADQVLMSMYSLLDKDASYEERLHFMDQVFKEYEEERQTLKSKSRLGMKGRGTVLWEESNVIFHKPLTSLSCHQGKVVFFGCPQGEYARRADAQTDGAATLCVVR